MSQSGSSSSQSLASTVATDKLIVPVGENLDNATTRTKVPSPGALAYDALTSRLYYGDSSTWILLDNSLGDGDVIGDTTAVVNTLVSYANSDGKHIKNITTIGATGGNLTGVSGINGFAIPTGGFGDVFGPSSSVDNRLATYDGASGKIIQDASNITAVNGNFSGVSGINGFPYPAGGYGDVYGPNVSVSGRVAGFTGTSGKQIYDMGITLSGNNTGDVTLAAFGTVPNANGASLSGQALTLQPASGASPGGVSATGQAFNGVKTFNDGIIFGGIGSTILNQFTRQTVNMNIRIGGSISVADVPFTFERIGNMVTVFMPAFQTAKADWGAGAATTIEPVPANFDSAGLALTAYGNMTTFYSNRPSGGASDGWIGYLRLLNGVFTVNPEYDNNTTSYDDFNSGGTGVFNGWNAQSVSYMVF